MKSSKKPVYLLTIVFSIVFLAAWAGKMDIVAPKHLTPLKLDTCWPKLYQDAIQDAMNPEPDEIVCNLIAIRQDNPELVWKDFDGVPHVLMVSLIGSSKDCSCWRKLSYADKPVKLEEEHWVTAVPELLKWCSELGPDIDIKERLKQILGLTPDFEPTCFVEFWVKPDDLFRPAADKEIDDNTAGLCLPDDVEPWYREWFNGVRAKQYFQSDCPHNDAYPWTQLGYTYDWGYGNTKEGLPEQGLSEFVIKTNSEVRIRPIYTIEDYCSGMGSQQKP